MRIPFIKNKNKSLAIKLSNGFTLVEVLIAISIFVTSALAMLVTLSSGLTQTSYARDRLVASYLAQEGVEYLRNTRDNYMLFSPNGFKDFKDALTDCYDGPCNFKESLNLSGQPIEFFKCSDDLTDCELGVEEGKYTDLFSNPSNIDNIPSGFKRKISAGVSGVDSNSIEVIVTVYWQQGSGTKSVAFSENLFNWYK